MGGRWRRGAVLLSLLSMFDFALLRASMWKGRLLIYCVWAGCDMDASAACNTDLGGQGDMSNCVCEHVLYWSATIATVLVSYGDTLQLREKPVTEEPSFVRSTDRNGLNLNHCPHWVMLFIDDLGLNQSSGADNSKASVPLWWGRPYHRWKGLKKSQVWEKGWGQCLGDLLPSGMVPHQQLCVAIQTIIES